MRITFQDRLNARTTNEGSSLSVVVKFWDDGTETWTANIPTNVYYRLDDINGNQITGWTNVTTGSSVTIALTGTQNAIVDDCKDYESKQLTVMANRGVTGQYQDAFVFKVRNLAGQV